MTDFFGSLERAMEKSRTGIRVCTKAECVFPYAHPEHKYSTYSMQQMVDLLCRIYHATEEELFELLVIAEMDRFALDQQAKQDEKKVEDKPVSQNEPNNEGIPLVRDDELDLTISGPDAFRIYATIVEGRKNQQAPQESKNGGQERSEPLRTVEDTDGVDHSLDGAYEKLVEHAKEAGALEEDFENSGERESLEESREVPVPNPACGNNFVRCQIMKNHVHDEETGRVWMNVDVHKKLKDHPKI